jgi:L-amino acid N-acyltransferase YncA
MRIRIAEKEDGLDIAEIYAPVVERTHISFELVPPSPEEMARRMSAALENHVFLVADAGVRVDGYAYASKYREKPAYTWSAETTIYVRDAARGTGVGQSLYRAL